MKIKIVIEFGIMQGGAEPRFYADPASAYSADPRTILRKRLNVTWEQYVAAMGNSRKAARRALEALDNGTTTKEALLDPLSLANITSHISRA